MKLIKCNNGHLYNEQAHSNCPYCDTNKILTAVSTAAPLILKSENKTISYWLRETAVAPVVGWLVCISGSEKGRDFRIINERNFIGRSEEMHIQIQNDLNIARKNHCSISYNPKQRIFVLSPGESSSLVYLQGKALYETKQIHNQDLIEIGESKFIFIALCGDSFDWNL